LLRSAGADLRDSHFHGGHIVTHHHLIILLGSWNLDFWDGNSEFWFLGFFDGFESFFLFLLIGLQSLGVVSADAKEVGPDEGNGDGEEKRPDDEGFLGLLVVDPSCSCLNYVFEQQLMAHHWNPQSEP
jgi:hypothetical protein